MLRWTLQHAFTGRGGVRQEEGDQATAAAEAAGLQSTLCRRPKGEGTVHVFSTCPWAHPPALPQRSAGLACAVEEKAA